MSLSSWARRQILEDLYPFQYIPLDRELLAEGKGRLDRRLPLLFSLHPNLTLPHSVMSGVERIYLHAAPMASLVSPFGWDHNQILGVDIPEVATHIPAVVEDALTPWEGANQFAASTVSDGVGGRRAVL